MKKTKLDIETGIVFLIFSFFIISIYSKNHFTIFLCIFFAFLLNLVFCISRKDFTLFIFLISFFILLLGRIFLFYFNIDSLDWKRTKTGYTFSRDIGEHILITLSCCLLGFLFSNFFRKKKTTSNSVFYCSSIKIILNIGFYFSALFALLINIIIFKYVITNGYLALYTNKVEIPFLFSKIAELNLFFFCFLICNQSKVILPVCIFIIISLSSVLSGARNELVLNILMLIWFYFYKKQSFSYRSILKLSFFGSLGFIFFVLIDYIRSNNFNNHLQIFELIKVFFQTQGISITVIGHIKEYENMLSKTGFEFLFYPQIDIFKSFFSSRSEYIGQTVNKAIETSFSQNLSYLVLKDRYLSGEGLGSSYAAEIYYTFGYIGVFFYSFFIAKLCSFFSNTVFYNPILLGISLVFVRALFYIPRAEALFFLNQILNLTFISFLLLVLLFANLINFSIKKDKNVKNFYRKN